MTSQMVPIFLQEHILSSEIFDLNGTSSADAVEKGKGSTNEEVEGSLRSKRSSPSSHLLPDLSPLKRKRRSPRGTTSVLAQSPPRATATLDDPAKKGTSGTSSQSSIRGTFRPDDSTREATDALALPGPCVTRPPAPPTRPRMKKVITKRPKSSIISHFPISKRLSSEEQTKVVSILNSHPGLTSPVDSALTPIPQTRDLVLSAHEEDSQLKGKQNFNINPNQ
ncbi:uncharacterized protein LOC133907202 [Phragmites australis]|uniref:uncharacterized protein LOC133907202 n=1 Tax=Phragmites australis TaxID=29695 RepID=UPI002D791FF9|nr:uncharacterized protein LOC133907202 [Phragmites australis]